MFLLAFSFAHFETTRGNTVKANISLPSDKSYLHCPKKFLLNFQNSQMKKRGETLFGECTYNRLDLSFTLYTLQSPPKEIIHFCRAEYSKLRAARWKVGGAPHHPLYPLGKTWANFCFEIPTDGDTRSKSSKTLRQLHWSQWKFLHFAMIENWLWVRLFLPVLPSVGISEPHLARIWPTPLGGWNTPRNYSSPPTFWVLGQVASVYFLLVETVEFKLWGYLILSFSEPIHFDLWSKQLLLIMQNIHAL